VLLFRGKSRRERRLRVASVLAAAAGSLVLIIVSQFAPLDRVQDNFNDSLFDRQQGSANVVIVRIGDEELERNGRLAAWPRSLHATAIDRLHDAGARVIVYDVLFADGFYQGLRKHINICSPCRKNKRLFRQW